MNKDKMNKETYESKEIEQIIKELKTIKREIVVKALKAFMNKLPLIHSTPKYFQYCKTYIPTNLHWSILKEDFLENALDDPNILAIWRYKQQYIITAWIEG